VPAISSRFVRSFEENSRSYFFELEQAQTTEIAFSQPVWPESDRLLVRHRATTVVPDGSSAFASAALKPG